MKIVINSCYGGFSLSDKATKLYWERKLGVPVFIVQQTGYYPNYSYKISEGEEDSFDSYASTTNNLELFEKDFNNYYLTNRPEERDDPVLIQVVEELGKEANGTCANLNIIEIPEDVCWEISEYDGYERVEETHRSWG